MRLRRTQLASSPPLRSIGRCGESGGPAEEQKFAVPGCCWIAIEGRPCQSSAATFPKTSRPRACRSGGPFSKPVLFRVGNTWTASICQSFEIGVSQGIIRYTRGPEVIGNGTADPATTHVIFDRPVAAGIVSRIVCYCYPKRFHA